MDFRPTAEEIRMAVDIMERFRIAMYGTEEEKLRASLPKYLYHAATAEDCQAIAATLVIDGPEVNFWETPEDCVQATGTQLGAKLLVMKVPSAWLDFDRLTKGPGTQWLYRGDAELLDVPEWKEV